MPSTSSMARWGARMVPPPTVPTSIEGMEQVMSRSSPSLMLRDQLEFDSQDKGKEKTYDSINVIHILDSTF